MRIHAIYNDSTDTYISDIRTPGKDMLKTEPTPNMQSVMIALGTLERLFLKQSFVYTLSLPAILGGFSS